MLCSRILVIPLPTFATSGITSVTSILRSFTCRLNGSGVPTEIGKLKAQQCLPSPDPERKAEQIASQRHQAALGKLDPDFAEKFLAFVSHELIRRHQLLSRGAIENAPHSTPIYY